MHALAGRFCLFDVRAAHIADDVIDVDRSYGQHDDERVCYPILSWRRLEAFLHGLRPAVAIEVASYYYPPSEFVHIADGIPEPFVLSIVLDRGASGFYGHVVEPR